MTVAVGLESLVQSYAIRRWQWMQTRLSAALALEHTAQTVGGLRGDRWDFWRRNNVGACAVLVALVDVGAFVLETFFINF